MTTNTEGYLVLKNYAKSNLRGGRTTTDTDEYLVFKVLLSPTYEVNRQVLDI